MQDGGQFMMDIPLAAGGPFPDGSDGTDACYDPQDGQWHNYNHAKCNPFKRPDSRVCFKWYQHAASRFAFYQTQRKWIPGALDTQTKCEADTCYPDFWITSNSTCQEISYCSDHGCKKCRTEGYHDVGPRVPCA